MRTVSDIHGLSATGGLRLRSARMWLDGKPRGELAFVPDLRRKPAQPGRVICTATLQQLWQPAPAATLAAPYCERFRLGDLHLELLPSGSTPGGAALAIEGGDRDILVATTSRVDTLPLAQPLPAFDADVIVVDAELAAFEHASVAQVEFAVGRSLDELAQGRRGTIWLFDDPLVALAVAAIVGDRAPIFANLGLKRWHWRYLRAAIGVPRVRRLGQQAQAGSFVLWPLHRAAELHDRDVDDFGWTLAAELADHARADEVGAEQAIAVSRRATGMELDQLIAATGAQEVVAIGSGAQALAARYVALPGEPQPTFWHLTEDRQLKFWPAMGSIG